MQLQTLIAFLESIAPTHLQEDYDNAGLIVGRPDKEIHSAIICLDSTDAIVEEAKSRKCDVIIAHHPIIFKGLKQLTGANYVERAVIEAIKHDIAIYAIHTNLDNILHNGVNSKIGERLGLTEGQILSPKDQSNGEIGAGLIGYLETPMDEKIFLNHVLDSMSLHVLKHTPFVNHPISKVAICGGSGSFLLAEAIRQDADAFISADFKYHEYFDADQQILVADIGHYESERFTMDLLHGLITKKFPNFAAYLANTITNPISFLIRQ